LHSRHKALGSIPSNTREKKRNQEERKHLKDKTYYYDDSKPVHPHQLVFHEGVKNTHWQRRVFTKQHTTINSKWIEALNVRPEIMKLLEENMGTMLQDMGIGKDFLNKTLKAQGTKTDKWDYSKLKSFCPTKEIITGVKQQPTAQNKYWQTPHIVNSVAKTTNEPGDSGQ
jgi:hypothetical protein